MSKDDFVSELSKAFEAKWDDQRKVDIRALGKMWRKDNKKAGDALLILKDYAVHDGEKVLAWKEYQVL